MADHTEHESDDPEHSGGEHGGHADFSDDLTFEEAGAGGHHGPLSELGFGAAAEELDFTEPTDFSFPSESGGDSDFLEGPAPVEHVTDDAILADSEGPGSDLALVSHAVVGEGFGDVETGDEQSLGESEAKSKRAAPPWLGKLEWGLVGFVVFAAFVLNGVAMAKFDNPSTVRLIWHVSYGVLLFLIPFSLWRSKKFWTTPERSAVFTVMAAIGVAALLTGIYCLGLELGQYNYDIKAKTANRMSAL